MAKAKAESFQAPSIVRPKKISTPFPPDVPKAKRLPLSERELEEIALLAAASEEEKDYPGEEIRSESDEEFRETAKARRSKHGVDLREDNDDEDANSIKTNPSSPSLFSSSPSPFEEANSVEEGEIKEEEEGEFPMEEGQEEEEGTLEEGEQDGSEG